MEEGWAEQAHPTVGPGVWGRSPQDLRASEGISDSRCRPEGVRHAGLAEGQYARDTYVRTYVRARFGENEVK